jgi:hypothetical protein
LGKNLNLGIFFLAKNFGAIEGIELDNLDTEY